MSESNSLAKLNHEVVRFDAEVQQLAWSIARAILEQELAGRRARMDREAPGRSRRRTTRRRGRAARAAAPASSPSREAAPAAQLELPTPAAEAPTAEAPAAPESAPTKPAEPRDGRRTKWTRETVTDELAKWLLNGSAVEAAWVTRHGPPGLVTAARRIFGRFEAALNVASLHLNAMYPDGLPEKRAR
ncbi:MAG: hypothetical protein ACTHU0_27685 [Kofleriaceae bacterium]